jgi:tetratricopeptide (TPR) repeat protein
MGPAAFSRAIRILPLVLAFAGPAGASPESGRLRARAAAELYGLDLDRALATYRQAVAEDPTDGAAHRGLASAVWIGIAFRRGTVTVDSYLGRLSRGDVKLPPPPPDVAAEFARSVDRAIALARERLAASRNDIDALYELGAAVGLRASYAATIEGGVRAAFGSAREAFNTHEKVLELAPRRRDAALIVGTYRYLVAAMSMPVRMVAYIAGFGGGRERGIGLVEQAAAFPGDNQTDAGLALVLLYNRERRYEEALKQLAALRARHPTNRLLWLESGATALRAERYAEADRFLSDGIALLTKDQRPRMFGENAVWYGKRGAARAALGRVDEATADLSRAVASEGRKWVTGRAHLELGKLSLQSGRDAAADFHLRTAADLCASDGDPGPAEEARRLLGRGR